ncbi:MAG: hypothetical protein ACTSVW_04775 [Candidatus Njordarchaeales archaeon]
MKKSKGVFIRLNLEIYNKLKKEAEKRRISLYRLTKDILEKYAEGKLKTNEQLEKETSKVVSEISAIMKKFSEIESAVNNFNRIAEIVYNNEKRFKELMEQVIVFEQKLNSINKRIKNIEKEFELRR